MSDDPAAEVEADPGTPRGACSASGSATGPRSPYPLLREGQPIGAILVRRIEVRPFSDKQIGLLETFADQAVIAIENVRLFTELEARNRELTEALEQQTATERDPPVISQLATDVQPVFETHVRERRPAVRCGLQHRGRGRTTSSSPSMPTRVQRRSAERHRAVPTRTARLPSSAGRSTSRRCSTARTPSTRVPELRSQAPLRTCWPSRCSARASPSAPSASRPPRPGPSRTGRSRC